ncbi:MAG: TRAP transporter small permease [Rhodospirillales bacterium]|nr:TRAP transporter small permease [Rhodospirillales bacterium]
MRIPKTLSDKAEFLIRTIRTVLFAVGSVLMRIPKVLGDKAEFLIRMIGTVLFAVMIVSIFYEVVMRYVFNAPTFWSEALARNSMIWVVVLGLSLGIRKKDNIRVDFMVYRMPGRLQAVLGYVRIALVAVFATIFVIYGARLALTNMTQTVTGLGIPVFWIYLCVPLSGLCMLIFLAETLIKKDTRPF